MYYPIYILLNFSPMFLSETSASLPKAWVCVASLIQPLFRRQLNPKPWFLLVPQIYNAACWVTRPLGLVPGSPWGNQTILSGAVKSGCVYMSPRELKEDFVCPHGLLHMQCPLKDGFILVSGLPHEITDSEWLSGRDMAES